MKKHPVKEVHSGHEVVVNPTTESLRQDECLCLNCDNMPTEAGDKRCTVEPALHEISVRYNIDLMITRCPGWISK